MNHFARNIVLEFTSKENIDFLKKSLNDYFNNQIVYRYLEEHFNENVVHFADVIEQELAMSDPLPGSTIYDQINCFNNQFIEERIGYINAHVIGKDNVPLYIVKDGLPTSRRGLATYQRPANDILQTWRGNSGRGVQAREDNAGDVNYNPYYGQGDNHMTTGIVFCDQSDLGKQRHLDAFENNPYNIALNKNKYAHEATAFGISTPESDQRLLNRRIFRRNESGVENGIPRYEARLYNRHLERNIDEGLRNAEKGCMLSGYDMSSLYNRIDQSNRTRQMYDKKPTNKLYNNNSKTEDSRYC